MPEFVASCVPETDLNGKPLDAFTRGYFEAIEFTGISIPEELYDEEGIDEVEWDEASVKKICEECEAFQNDNTEDLALYLEVLDKDPSYGALDFWLNRNRNGSGFWDNKYGQSEEMQEACDRLDKYSHEEGSRHVFFQDGKLYYE